MKHLVIFAHPNKDSYNGAVLSTVTSTLEKLGHTVEVHDLYERKFSPILSTDDLASYRAGNPAADIVAEQNAVADADVVTFVFPVWWAAAPAILKGWLDRVFSFGFAYRFTPQGTIDQLLKGKKGVVVATQGTPSAVYGQSGMAKSMGMVIDDGVYRFTGIEPVLNIALGSVTGVESRDQLAKNLDEVEASITKAFSA